MSLKLLVLFIILFICVSIFIINKKISIKTISIPEIIPDTGFVIPVFSGSLGRPVTRIGNNIINPLFIINNNTITTRVFFLKHTKQIKDIEKIGIYQMTPLYQNIILYFNESFDDNEKNFGIVNPFKEAKIESFNLLNKENLKQLIKFFNNKNISLTEDAKELLNK